MATERLTISCDDCVMAGTGACADCLVTFVVGATLHAVPDPSPAAGPPEDRHPVGEVALSGEEVVAVRTLAGAGLVSELRFVRRVAG